MWAYIKCIAEAISFMYTIPHDGEIPLTSTQESARSILFQGTYYQCKSKQRVLTRIDFEMKIMLATCQRILLFSLLHFEGLSVGLD